MAQEYFGAVALSEISLAKPIELSKPLLIPKPKELDKPILKPAEVVKNEPAWDEKLQDVKEVSMTVSGVDSEETKNAAEEIIVKAAKKQGRKRAKK